MHLRKHMRFNSFFSSSLLVYYVFWVAVAFLSVLSPKLTLVPSKYTANLTIEKPYSYSLGKEGPDTLSFKLNYQPWKNPVFTFGLPPQSNKNVQCISKFTLSSQLERSHQENEIFIDLLNYPQRCTEMVIDLGKHLHPGDNIITLRGLNKLRPTISDKKDQSKVYVSSTLFGAHLSSTIACAVIIACFVFLVFRFSQKMGCAARESGIIMCGVAYYSLWLWFRPNLAYTPDIEGHMQYIYYMANSLFINPYGYTEHQSFHPPLYYFFAARIWNMASALGGISEVSVLRFFSLLQYMLFCLFGIKTLAEFMTRKDISYYLGCLLMMFWPLAIDKASDITNDIPLYVFWSASFYYVCNWYRTGRSSSLGLAIGLTGVAFMIKSGAIVILGIVGLCILYALLRRQVAFIEMFRPAPLVGGVVLFLGAIFNIGRIIYYSVMHNRNVGGLYFGGARQDIYPLSYYINFDYLGYIKYPFVRFKAGEPTFLNYFLKTFVYSPFYQKFDVYSIAATLNALLLIFLATIILFMCVMLLRLRREFNLLFPCIIGVVMAFAGAIGFLLVEKYEHCQNFRYVLPTLIPMIILFVLALQKLSDQKNVLSRAIYLSLSMAGFAIPLLGIIIYLGKYTELVL